MTIVAKRNTRSATGQSLLKIYSTILYYIQTGWVDDNQRRATSTDGGRWRSRDDDQVIYKNIQQERERESRLNVAITSCEPMTKRLAGVWKPSRPERSAPAAQRPAAPAASKFIHPLLFVTLRAPKNTSLQTPLCHLWIKHISSGNCFSVLFLFSMTSAQVPRFPLNATQRQFNKEFLSLALLSSWRARLFPENIAPRRRPLNRSRFSIFKRRANGIRKYLEINCGKE